MYNAGTAENIYLVLDCFFSAYGEDCTSQGRIDKGSLFQLRNLLGRSQVTKLVKANVFAAEDFLEVVTQVHVVGTHFFADGNLTTDKVNLHARELMLMGLLWYSFKDAISEGDGPAVMSFWKVLTVMFRLTGHTK